MPFGYRPVKLARGWGYEPDPEYAPIVAEMCERYVHYESLGSIARWLNESGVPTPWNATRKRNDKPLRGHDVEDDQRPEDTRQPGDPGCHCQDRRHAGHEMRRV